MSYKEIIYEVKERIATITLNRPDKLNAFTGTMRLELLDALDQADTDDNVRVVIFTGAGRGYCAGADLSDGGDKTFTRSSDTSEEFRDGGGTLVLRIFDMQKPLIAAINGPAVGVGATMTLPMDVRLASDQAKMGFVFTRRAIAPDGCCTWFLPRIVGIGKATEWMMSGKVFTAQEGFESGLINEVLAPEDLLPAAYKLAKEMATNTSAISSALTRQLLWRMLGADHPMVAHRIESKCVQYMSTSADCTEGVDSFLEKRAPNFSMSLSQDMPDFWPWWEPLPFAP